MCTPTPTGGASSPADGERAPFEDEVGQLLGDNVEEEEEEEGEDLFGDNLERCVCEGGLVEPQHRSRNRGGLGGLCPLIF